VRYSLPTKAFDTPMVKGPSPPSPPLSESSSEPQAVANRASESPAATVAPMRLRMSVPP
jgi:hypothetical protein